VVKVLRQCWCMSASSEKWTAGVWCGIRQAVAGSGARQPKKRGEQQVVKRRGWYGVYGRAG